jgi:hypothetical protein
VYEDDRHTGSALDIVEFNSAGDDDSSDGKRVVLEMRRRGELCGKGTWKNGDSDCRRT